METINVTALQGMKVDDIKPSLAKLSKEQLEQLRALEVAEGEGKTRSTLIAAIDAQLATLAAEQGGEGQTGGEQGQTGGDQTGGDQTGGDQTGSDQTGGEQGGGEQGALSHGDDGVAATATNGAAAGSVFDDVQAALDAERDRIAREVEVQNAARELIDRGVAVARENAVRLFSEARLQLGDLDGGDVLVDGAELYFSEGESFLAGMAAVPIAPSAVSMEGGRLIVNEAIDFPPMAPSARIEAVWLHSEGDWAMTRLMQPLVIGGGHEARLPAGHLAFAVN